MKLVTYTADESAPRARRVIDDGVIDVERASNGALAGSLFDLLQHPGHAKGRFLSPGDVMQGEIEGIGTLRTPAVAP